MKCTVILGGGFLCVVLGSSVAAQEQLAPGRYTGNYEVTQTQGARISIVLDIKSTDNGTLTGTGERYYTNQYGSRGAGGCNGTFPLAGTVKGDAIDVGAAEKFGSNRDCQWRLRGKVSGNKIVGKVGQNDVELSR